MTENRIILGIRFLEMSRDAWVRKTNETLVVERHVGDIGQICTYLELCVTE